MSQERPNVPDGVLNRAQNPNREVPGLRVRRLPEKQIDERAGLDVLLDTALVAHVGFTDPGTAGVFPLVVPMAFARDGDRVLVHGSTASRAFKALAAGAPACATITVIEGLVVARSQFESSMHYRTAKIFGRFVSLEGAAKDAGLSVLSERLLQGMAGARPPAEREVKATAVLALNIERWSLKVSNGHPPDDAADLDRPVWAGVVPLEHRWGAPIDASDLKPGFTAPDTTTWRHGQT